MWFETRRKTGPCSRCAVGLPCTCGGEPHKPPPPPRRVLPCPDCRGTLTLRSGRFGLFYGCNAYPLCTGSHSATKDGEPCGTPGDSVTRLLRRKVLAMMSGMGRIYGLNQAGVRAFCQGLYPHAETLPNMTATTANGLLNRFLVASREDLESAERRARAVETLSTENPTPRTGWHTVFRDEEYYDDDSGYMYEQHPFGDEDRPF